MFPNLVGGESIAGIAFTISVRPAADVTLNINSVNPDVIITPTTLQWTSSLASPLSQTVTVSASEHASSATSVISYSLTGTNSNATTDYYVPADGSITLIPQRVFVVPDPLLAVMSGQTTAAQTVSVTVPNKPPIDVTLTPTVPDLGGRITFTPPSLTFTANGATSIQFTVTAATGVSGGSFPVMWRVSGSNAASFTVPANSTLPIGCSPGYNGTASTGCVDINECVEGTAVCHPFSSCFNTPGSYVCTPFVWPGTLRLVNGSGTNFPKTVLADTLGGQVLSFLIDVGVGDISIGPNSLLGWSGKRQFPCAQYWTNLTGPYIPPAANGKCGVSLCGWMLAVLRSSDLCVVCGVCSVRSASHSIYRSERHCVLPHFARDRH